MFVCLTVVAAGHGDANNNESSEQPIDLWKLACPHCSEELPHATSLEWAQRELAEVAEQAARWREHEEMRSEVCCASIPIYAHSLAPKGNVAEAVLNEVKAELVHPGSPLSEYVQAAVEEVRASAVCICVTV